MSAFAAFWESRYRGVHPAGWMMLVAGTQWWVRFHSLPLSKRYADTDDERRILLNRQNKLATEVLGEGAPIWFVQTHWVTSAGQIDIADLGDPFKETREFPLSHAFSFERDEGDGDESLWHVMAARTVWEAGAFDTVLLRIADEEAGPTLWVSGIDGAVFAPYDGGVDLFLSSNERRDQLMTKFASWLPTHPAGRRDN